MPFLDEIVDLQLVPAPWLWVFIALNVLLQCVGIVAIGAAIGAGRLRLLAALPLALPPLSPLPPPLGDLRLKAACILSMLAFAGLLFFVPAVSDFSFRHVGCDAQEVV